MSAVRSLAESVLTRAWQRRGALALALWPLSLLFGALVALRRAAYQSGCLSVQRLPVPVIVVGNVYVGGTGKTPLVIWLAQQLSAAGYRPGVISRGYRHQSSGHSTPQLVDCASDVRLVGDEPLLIARRTGCPVMIGRDRPAAARALLTMQPTLNVIISDDGLQHYALGREIEIVLGDERGVGNGWLLPAGPLREPASRRRDFTVVNAASMQPTAASFQMQLVGVLAEQLCDRTQRMPLTSPLYVGPAADPDQQRQASRVVAAAGIGNPERFFALLRATGLAFDPLPLADHYPFIDNPFADESADVILITEKDAVKCAAHPALRNDSRIWVVPITARLEAGLIEAILEKLRGHSIA